MINQSTILSIVPKPRKSVLSNRRKTPKGMDLYPTPPAYTRAFLEHEPISGDVWEPACGFGHMSEVLKDFCDGGLRSSDLYDHGYGEINIDFLSYNGPQVDNIITNPPYKCANDFVYQGLKLARKKLCLLVKTSFLEGIDRYERIYKIFPPTRVYQYSYRLTFYPNTIEFGKKERGTMAFAWFVWDMQVPRGKTELLWITRNNKKTKKK